MPRAHFVKSARKSHPDHGIKKGDSYYWWAFMSGGRGGPKHYSKVRPKQSQLTQSAFLGAVFSIQEQAAETNPTMEDVESELDNLVSDLQGILDEEQGKLDNMPDGLREGDSGSMIQERIDALGSAISELDSVDCTCEDSEGEEDSKDETRNQRAIEIWEECNNLLDLSCS